MDDIPGSRAIRVLVEPLPPVVDEIVRQALSGHEDIEVIGPTGREREVLPTIAEWCPDVVILSAVTEGVAAACQMAMPLYPSVRVLQIGGHPVNIYEVRLLAANAGIEAVVEAIRAAA